MSISTIETAWIDKIWQNLTILNITDKIHNFEITDTSQFELDQLSFNQELNYFEWVVTRAIQYQPIGAENEAVCKIMVEIRYTRQKDTTGENWRSVRDVFSDLITLVHSELGSSWDSTVDFYTHQQDPADITTDLINDVPCWRGTYRFEATLQESV
jgi:hypothetical protein